MIPRPLCVLRTEDRVKPAAAKSRRNSASVRSRPVTLTSMVEVYQRAALVEGVPLPDALRQHGIEDNETTRAGHGCPHGAQDPGRVRVVPVMDDPLQNVRVATRRDELEEAPADKLAPVGHATLGEEGARGLDDAREVDQDASRGLTRSGY